MAKLRTLTLAAALLIALGEMARWWGNPRLVPMALDELLVAGLMIAACIRPRPSLLLLSWGAFCGLVLGLLVPTLDHLLHGPPKESAGFYALVLGAMLVLGIAAAAYAVRLTRKFGSIP